MTHLTLSRDRIRGSKQRGLSRQVGWGPLSTPNVRSSFTATQPTDVLSHKLIIATKVSVIDASLPDFAFKPWRLESSCGHGLEESMPPGARGRLRCDRRSS